jgi:hypothetical protein
MKLKLMGGLICLAFILAGCGGSSSSSSTSSSSSVVASDPYIYGAVFNEIAEDGSTVLQASTLSTITGDFTFSSALTEGSTLKMSTTEGVSHATLDGTTYSYEGELLTRRVTADVVTSAASGTVAITPLTTLADRLQTAAEESGETLTEDEVKEAIVAMLGDDTTVTVDDLFEDPMAAVEADGEDTDLLVASMAVAFALEASDDDFEATLEASLELVETVFDTDAEIEDQLVALVAIAEVVSDADDILEVVENFDEDDIEDIVEAVADLAAEDTLVIEEDGSVEISNAQTVFDALLDSVTDQLEDVYAYEGESINADIFDLAADLASIKSTLDANVDLEIDDDDLEMVNFFYAFGRVALLMDPLTDDSSDGLETLGDVLDAFGVDTSEDYRLSGDFAIETFPETTPTTDELQSFLYLSAATELQTAITALEAISTDFSYELSDTEFDYSDVYYVDAAANASLFQISLQQGLNISADIKDLADADDDDYTLGEALDDQDLQDTLLKTKDATALASAQAYGIVAVNGMLNCIDAIRAETDDQADDFLSFYDDEEADIEQTEADLNDALDVLNGEATFTNSDGTTDTVDLTGFFAGTIDLNSLLPTITDDEPGMFPDETLAGMLTGDMDINEDSDEDGIPDILQMDDDDDDYWDETFTLNNRGTLTFKEQTCTAVSADAWDDAYTETDDGWYLCGDSESIYVPDDAYVRIVPTAAVDVGNYNMKIICDIDEAGYFGDSCWAPAEYTDDLTTYLSNSTTEYQFVVFKNTDEGEDKIDWDGDEDSYFYGSEYTSSDWSLVDIETYIFE